MPFFFLILPISCPSFFLLPENNGLEADKCTNSPATNQTLADFTARAAQAAANVSPQMPGTAPAAGGGQTTGATMPAATDPAAAPASGAPAATATRSAAGMVVRNSWALTLVGAAAIFVW